MVGGKARGKIRTVGAAERCPRGGKREEWKKGGRNPEATGQAPHLANADRSAARTKRGVKTPCRIDRDAKKILSARHLEEKARQGKQPKMTYGRDARQRRERDGGRSNVERPCGGD